MLFMDGVEEIMKKFFVIGALFAASAALATEVTVLRDFRCQAIPEALSPNTQAPEAFEIQMTDIAKRDSAESEAFIYNSTLHFKASFMPALHTGQIPYLEDRSADIETERDDDPESRSGWGGTGFYGFTHELKKESLLFVTKALQEQQGKNVRDYAFAIVHITVDPSGQNPDGLQQIIAQGSMKCRQSR
jgi:hypothetical protein